ncbi:extracellular triacylglycerol lipase precursor [Lentinus tigrinus ALCF2SS1-7]|uniref:Carboxylic ester hydrolase n=1 Tax=Lentinus tigrinus ALCF2SS1-6 TaxID=1328759 RepID=A0A5C2RTX7_9APHY|nr:extracellular triacylglycerol lipase precursor [Lentinus tigrinus ALCF2SS1-6]RPD76804.1 extracellular triacylglycerol lipase precursor [Lentinus tigrinus ALCF2SS1-7]
MEFSSTTLQVRALRALAAAAILFALGPLSVLAQPPQVKVGGATITGVSQTFLGALGIDFFGGIPFAQPPVGNLRFAPPVLMDGFGVDTLDATKFGAPCVQFNVAGVSEDCLTLNVFRPSGVSSNASLPVMVWIYGGGFLQGVSSVFNASGIIAQSVLRGTPVVYVSLNYRVGPFGFPQGTEADTRGALNLGLKDQLKGLQWVQNHISAFGGDPTKVTIFGQSAGSISIADLYLNSELENYVRGAIMESGSAGTLPFFNASRRDVVWNTYVSDVPGCANVTAGDTFSCMQSVDTATLLTAWEQTAASFPEPFLFVPVIDGPDGLVPDLPSKLLAAGKFSKIPFIAGTNLDEGTDFTPTAISTDEQVIEFITVDDQPFTTNPPAKFQQDVATLLQLYPDNAALGSPFGTGNETFGFSSQYKRASALLGDASFQGPRREWIQAASTAGVKTFGYYFTDQNAVTTPSKGVTHALEIPYVYGQTALTSPNPAVRLLSEAMVDYWISFAVSLTPNDGKGLNKTTWPQYQSGQQVLLQFDTGSFAPNTTTPTFAIISDDYRSQQIGFINSIASDLGE